MKLIRLKKLTPGHYTYTIHENGQPYDVFKEDKHWFIQPSGTTERSEPLDSLLACKLRLWELRKVAQKAVEDAPMRIYQPHSYSEMDSLTIPTDNETVIDFPMPPERRLTTRPTIGALASAGQYANAAAAGHVFEDYTSRKAANTLRRQRTDLALFAQYLTDVGIAAPDPALQTDPAAWQGMTWGLVSGFVQWMLQAGYAVASVNVRLSTVKRYAALAFQAGAIDATEHALIKTVSGYSHKETKHVDEQRSADSTPTRRGNKKAVNVTLTSDQRSELKRQPTDTAQGRRDALLMCLLLDHGLRCGEVALLEVRHVNLADGTLTFHRPKVDKVQTHKLTRDALKAMKAYFRWGDAPLPADALLLRGSRKDGTLTEGGMSERAITKRVRVLGEAIGISGLSAHDCRHSWATYYAHKGVDPFRLQEAGGWNSLSMPRRYVDSAKIANEGME